MTLMAVLESDLRALSAEARRRNPNVKDAAEHAILKVRTVKLSVIGLSCLQKLISHDAVAPSALEEILCTLKD
ncbi:unnamed protein product [Cuscuta campestris]|uniref:Mon2/Sec7/BIG1-like dimerisation and cyclophilin-binding domain-containing protein n=1 Tax=Cuscuta campestris TaxID=132261 RepID=A0A484M8U3_9ASTE|nr:unnamed protein product [Cuscuta campestris]